MPDEITIAAPVITPPVQKAESHAMGRPKPTMVEPPKEHLEMEFKIPDDLTLASSEDRVRIEEPIVINTNAKETSDITDQKGLVDKSKKAETKAEAKVEKSKVEEVKKPEVKAEEKKEEKKRSPLDMLKMPEKKADEVQTEVKPQDHQSRDYSIFDEDEQKAARQMSNEAFKQFTKLKTAAKTNDQLFYQHPDAYLTHPQYKQLSTDVQYGEAEISFWEQQLLACKEGKDVRNLTGYDPKTGAPVFGAPVKASPMVEEKIRELIYNTRQNTTNAKASLQSLQGTYKKEFETVRSNFVSERAKRFAWAQNPELLNATLDVTDDQGNKIAKTVKQIKDDFKQLFPAYLVNDMGVEVASDLLVSLVMQKNFYSGEASKEAIKETIKNEEHLVEPSSQAKAKSKGDAFGGVTEFSISGMPQ